MNNYQIDRQSWAKFTINEQMGNIGSEVGRSIKAWRAGDTARFEGALGRALDLFSATAELLAKRHSPRLKEVLRSRDQYLALFYDDKFSDAPALENYFTQFVLAARAHR